MPEDPDQITIDKKEHLLSECGKVFPSQFNLKRHVKTHQKESVGSVPDFDYENSYFEEIESPYGT